MQSEIITIYNISQEKARRAERAEKDLGTRGAGNLAEVLNFREG